VTWPARLRWFEAFLIAMVTAPLPVAGAGDAPPKEVASVEGITEYRLDNGLRVLVFPDPSTPKVTVNMTVLVGSRHEGYGETGMAHLLEHLVFKGTPTHRNIPQAMKERGAQFNGSTSPDRTNYFETLPASDDNLEFAIRLEADRLVNSFVSGDDLRTEMTVVRNEFESGENSPRRVLMQRMEATAFEWHNYGKSTIGNRSDIERVPIDNLRAFYRKFYQPDNVVLVVAGNFDRAKALDLVSKYFGPIPKPDRKLDDTYTEEPAQDGERVVTLRRVGDTPLVGVMYHVPAASHPDSPAVRVLASILSSQPSGPLYKALVEPKKAAYASASARPMHDPGTMTILAELPKGGSVDEVRDVILATVEGVKERGVTREEVDRARRLFLNAHERAANDPTRLAVSLSQEIAEGDWRLHFLDRDRIEQVTPERVAEVAAKYLVRSNRTVGIFLPTDQPQRAPIPSSPDIAGLVAGYKGRSAGAEGEALDPSPSAIEARVARPGPIEGIKVALLPRKTRGEMVYLRLTLRYGDAESLKGYEEAADFLPSLMVRGTRSLTRQEIQDTLSKLVASIGGGGQLGSASFSVSTKRANLPAVLDVLRQVLREPALAAEEFEVMKVGRLAAIEQGRSEPGVLANNRLARLMADYPRGDVRHRRTIDETIEDLKATTVEKVRTLYRDYLGASQGELAIVGNFEPSEILPIVAKALEGWKSGKPYARIEEPFQGGLKAARETIATPDKANATYVAGLAMPVGDEHPDYPALVIGNFILGGGSLSSRLGDRLRQKGGLSYGAGSSFFASSLDPRAELRVRAIANPGNVPKVVAGVDEEIERLLRDGVSPGELEEAKAGYLQQRKVGRSNDATLVGMLANHLHLGRTLQFDADLEQSIGRLTPEAVNAALRKHLDPKRMSVITAGDFKEGDSR
jgi:zinc protease